MSLSTGRVHVERATRRVVWNMSQAEARDLARWMREELPAGDLALRDADALDVAANELDPKDDAPGIRIGVVLR